MITTTYDPEQWQLVPKVATDEMLNATFGQSKAMQQLGSVRWEDFLAAAPQHPDTGETTSPESNSPT